ncbi:hypothetical protein ACFL5Z_09565 [Planctomycetota bacterium]
MKKLHLYPFLFVLFILVFQGCGDISEEALRMDGMTLEEKQLQTRLFDTTDERKILSASEGILQDLGFKLVEREMDLGLIVGSKDRDAVKAGHILLTAIWSGLNNTPSTYSEKIRISVVTSPAGGNAQRTSVRVIFQRIIWDNYGRLSKLERLNVPELYQGFFKKLYKAVFPEAYGSRYESSPSRILTAQGSQVKFRNIKSRILNTTDKIKTLRAVMVTLQDLGFVINKADNVLRTVHATKLDQYAMRITVSVRSHSETQMHVRANAQYNLKTIEDPEPYQQFFAALEKAMFPPANNIE